MFSHSSFRHVNMRKFHKSRCYPYERYVNVDTILVLKGSVFNETMELERQKWIDKSENRKKKKETEKMKDNEKEKL